MAEAPAQADKSENSTAQEPDGGSENVAATQVEATADDSSQPNETPQSELMQWRYRVLPTMQNILYFVTAVFFLSGLVQLGYLQWSIMQGSKIDREDLPSILPQYAEGSETMLLEAAKFEASVMLESYVLERRYHQANTALMTMAWIRYLGFSTGMILAIVGASFILGMLREKPTDLSAESAGWRFSLTSSSPGIIMVVLGVILMFATITHRQTFDLKDAAVYYDTRITTFEPEPTVEPTRPGLTQPTRSADE